MVWIFLTVVLLLVVLHPGFRRVMGWIGGIGITLAAVAVLVVWLNDRKQPDDGWNVVSQTPAAGKFVPDSVPTCPPGMQSTPGVCFAPVSEAPLPPLPPGYKLDCPDGQLSVANNLTHAPSCYNPHDAKQLAEHLKECTPPNSANPSHWESAPVIADARGIPCNVYDQFDNDCPEPPETPWPGCISRDSKPWEKYRAGRQGAKGDSAH